AAVVEHGGATRQSGRQPFQAQMGGRMAAGSKGKARIQLDAYNAARLGVRKRQHGIFRMPAGNYPDLVAYLDGTKLRLRQTYPVLVGYITQRPFRVRHLTVGFVRQLLQHLPRVQSVRQQRNDTIVAPGLDFWLETRLAIQGVLDFRVA